MAQRIVDDGLGGKAQELFGKGFRLSQQRPRPIGQSEPRIGVLPRRLDRQDV